MVSGGCNPSGTFNFCIFVRYGHLTRLMMSMVMSVLLNYELCELTLMLFYFVEKIEKTVSLLLTVP